MERQSERGTADRKEAEMPGEEEHLSLGHSLGVSGELEPEDGSSSAPCLLLLQGDQIFHIFCKRAVLEITVSLLRRNQLTGVPSRVNTQE